MAFRRCFTDLCEVMLKLELRGKIGQIEKLLLTVDFRDTLNAICQFDGLGE